MGHACDSKSFCKPQEHGQEVVEVVMGWHFPHTWLENLIGTGDKALRLNLQPPVMSAAHMQPQVTDGVCKGRTARLCRAEIIDFQNHSSAVLCCSLLLPSLCGR
jgi:hypothetical protein